MIFPGILCLLFLEYGYDETLTGKLHIGRKHATDFNPLEQYATGPMAPMFHIPEPWLDHIFPRRISIPCEKLKCAPGMSRKIVIWDLHPYNPVLRNLWLMYKTDANDDHDCYLM